MHWLYLALGVTSALFVGAIVVAYSIWFACRDETAVYRERAEAAERHLSDVLDRISTSPRLELDEAHPMQTIEPTTLRYIPDTPHADDVWNEYRGEPDEDEVMQ